MIKTPIIQQPESNHLFTLMPDEHVRFEYVYKPGCCYCSSQTTIITNMRLITQIVDVPSICSKSSQQHDSMVFLTDNIDSKQIQSILSARENTWWMKIVKFLTCTCDHQQMNLLNLSNSINTPRATRKNDDTKMNKNITITKF